MQTKPPKNDRNYYWTMHSQYKLFQYGLTPNRIKRIIRHPDRKEEGIAPETIAVMQQKNRKDPKKGEVWVMYQKKSKVKSEKPARNASHKEAGRLKVEKEKNLKDNNKKSSVIGNQSQSSNNILPGQIKIISAWIYPAESPKGKEIFIPDEAWEELQDSLK